jgi:hypothetical protein
MVLDLEPGSERYNVRFTIADPPAGCRFAPPSSPSDRAATGSISGRVTAVSAEPLSCAIVWLVAADGGARRVQTDP